MESAVLGVDQRDDVVRQGIVGRNPVHQGVVADLAHKQDSSYENPRCLPMAGKAGPYTLYRTAKALRGRPYYFG